MKTGKYRKGKTVCLSLIQFAKEHFKHNLFHSDEGKSVALSYFKNRGFSDETIQKFDLGYSMESYNYFLQDGINKGYKPELMRKTGFDFF